MKKYVSSLFYILVILSAFFIQPYLSCLISKFNPDCAKTRYYPHSIYFTSSLGLTNINLSSQDNKSSSNESEKPSINIEFNDKKIELSKSQVDFILRLIKQRLIIIEDEMKSVYIEPILWGNMDTDLRADFGATIAIYCGNRSKNISYCIDIYDKDTGKKLAKYDSKGLIQYKK